MSTVTDISFETKTYTDREGAEKTYVVKYITMDITIDGETRSVVFDTIYKGGEEKRAHSAQVFGCKCGQGAKVHRTKASIWNDGDDNWRFERNSGYALNRGNQRIIAWADTVSEYLASQHIGTKIEGEVK